ncbi:hypothetical protein [Paraburkholderia xenovorans]|uniref:hypothetical protein n=1 Tax=Paraburkholderia xenovorans TaxID=36873 RepID=UPI0015C53908|nr:hypothetical protein [Paraburkholderia xenovorans]
MLNFQDSSLGRQRREWPISSYINPMPVNDTIHPIPARVGEIEQEQLATLTASSAVPMKQDIQFARGMAHQFVHHHAGRARCPEYRY